MSDFHQGVVMFPGWRKELERKSFEAVKHKNFEEALIHIEKLESFDEASNELLTAKIICHIELNQYDEAISLCRRLMREDDIHYFKYLHIYLTILFQTSQYSEIVDLLDEINETSSIPQEYEASFKQIYDMSLQFKDQIQEEESDEHIDHFLNSLENGNFQEQWKLLSFHRKHSIKPHLKQLVPYLCDTRLNPVVKTGILQWCMEEGIEQAIEVEKFGETEWVIPNQLNDILETDFAVKVLNELEDVEQSDPTLYEFTKQIFYRYLYIRFPYTPGLDEAHIVAKSVLALAQQYLQLNHEVENEDLPIELSKWMGKIEHLEKVYFSQIDDS